MTSEFRSAAQPFMFSASGLFIVVIIHLPKENVLEPLITLPYIVVFPIDVRIIELLLWTVTQDDGMMAAHYRESTCGGSVAHVPCRGGDTS